MTPRASVSQVNRLIHGGYVLTMDSPGDIPGGNVHVRDTHWHMWNTLLCGMSDGGRTARAHDEFALSARDVLRPAS
jgi:hypothetical protein